MEIEFRYGATWQYRYRLGDSLAWGRNNVGDESREAAVRGVVDGPCPTCDYEDDWEVVVVVRKSGLVAVLPSDEQFDFTEATFAYLKDPDVVGESE